MGSVTESFAIEKYLSHPWVAGLDEFLVAYGSAREHKYLASQPQENPGLHI
jgi:hypothetical protein